MCHSHTFLELSDTIFPRWLYYFDINCHFLKTGFLKKIFLIFQSLKILKISTGILIFAVEKEKSLFPSKLLFFLLSFLCHSLENILFLLVLWKRNGRDLVWNWDNMKFWQVDKGLGKYLATKILGIASKKSNVLQY